MYNKNERCQGTKLLFSFAIIIMTCCTPLIQRNIETHPDLYKSSYDRSYFYENVVDHSFTHVRVKRKIRDDLKVVDPVVLKTFETVNNTTFAPKYLEKCKPTDFLRRSSTISQPTLNSLHEKYIADPPRPLKYNTTTTGTSYDVPRKLYEPQIWSQAAPIAEFTCPIASQCKDGLPTFLPNEPGYVKHLDPYISTSQLIHCDFSLDQQNGVARKNVITFWDTLGLAKNRGFGPKKLEPYGSYFHQGQVVTHRVHPKTAPSVPFFGRNSTYESNYDFVATNLMYREHEVNYPAVYKPIENLSYSTEQSHVGTGWPVRGELNIGTVRGTC